jgi:Fe-S cluster assembly protein SufB
MSNTTELAEITDREYEYGFVTDIEAETIPKGLNEEVVRIISAKKEEPQWLLQWRLKAYHRFAKMLEEGHEPTWAMVTYPTIDYQDMYYYSAPKKKEQLEGLDQVDPELLRTYEKLGIPLEEQKRLAGVAVDAVFDSVSVATTYKEELEKQGIIFCPFSEAVRRCPEIVKKYLGSVVPYADNFFAALNSAVFSDGSFAYIPKGVRCPMELSTYFRINAQETGQFERTLIIAEEGSYVSYLEGCTAPMRRREPASRRGRRAGRPRRRRDQVLDGPELVSGRQAGQGRYLQLRHQARQVPGQAIQGLLDPGGDRLRDHLEVPELHPPGRAIGG